MPDRGLAAALVALVVTTGCGRIGFSAAGDGESTGDGGDPPCVTTSFPVTASATRTLFPAMVWNGTKLGIVWTEDPTGTPSGQFRSVSLEGAADPIVDLGVPGPTEDLDVAWDGASWRFAWSEDTATDREIFRSTDGAPAQAITANTQTDLEVRLAPLSGGTTAYLWVTQGNNTRDLVLAVLDAAGTKLVDNVTIATGLNAIDAHDLVWTGSELVAFYALPTQLVMLRMTSSGSTIAGPIPIATESVSSEVSASWLGDRFLVTWYSSGIHIAYAAPDGALLFPIVKAPFGSQLRLRMTSAVGKTSDVVVWDDIGTGSAYLLPVARDGTLGTLAELPHTSSLAAAWVDTHWAIAASQGDPQDITLLQFCP